MRASSPPTSPNRFRVRLRSIFAVAALSMSLALTGCAELLEQLTAENVALATLVQTPDLENPATGETIRGVTTFTLFFGKVERPDLNGGTLFADGDTSFSGLEEAQVTLEFVDPETEEVRQLNVADNGSGTYSLDSSTAERLEYHSGATYTVTIKYAGKTHKLSVEAPERQSIEEFEGLVPRIVTNHPATEDFVVTRVLDDESSDLPPAFVSLLSLAGEGSTEAWTNRPSDGMALLQFALNPAPWKKESFTIDSSRLQPDTSYLVTVSTLSRGSQDTGPDLSSLFTASSFLAGTADGGGLLTAATDEGDGDEEGEEEDESEDESDDESEDETGDESEEDESEGEDV